MRWRDVSEGRGEGFMSTGSVGMPHAVPPTKDGDRACCGLGSEPSASAEPVPKII